MPYSFLTFEKVKLEIVDHIRRKLLRYFPENFRLAVTFFLFLFDFDQTQNCFAHDFSFPDLAPPWELSGYGLGNA